MSQLFFPLLPHLTSNSSAQETGLERGCALPQGPGTRAALT